MRNSDAKKREKRQSEGRYRRVGQEPGQNAVFSHFIIKPRFNAFRTINVPKAPQNQSREYVTSIPRYVGWIPRSFKIFIFKPKIIIFG